MVLVVAVDVNCVVRIAFDAACGSDGKTVESAVVARIVVVGKGHVRTGSPTIPPRRAGTNNAIDIEDLKRLDIAQVAVFTVIV